MKYILLLFILASCCVAKGRTTDTIRMSGLNQFTIDSLQKEADKDIRIQVFNQGMKIYYLTKKVDSLIESMRPGITITLTNTLNALEPPDSVNDILHPSFVFYAGALPVYPKDTVPCIMLCCDTTQVVYTDGSRSSGHKNVPAGMALWWKGFEVRYKIDQPWRENSNDVYYEHISYLDADKKPLPETIIVWMSKPLKP